MAIRTKKDYVEKISTDVKEADFYADFKSVTKILKRSPLKSDRKLTFYTFLHFKHFLSLNFCVLFSTLLTDFKSASTPVFLDISIGAFLNFFYIFTTTYLETPKLNAPKQMAKKKAYYKSVLNLFLAYIYVFILSVFSKDSQNHCTLLYIHGTATEKIRSRHTVCKINSMYIYYKSVCYTLLFSW
jgi:hypothetical protein